MMNKHYIADESLNGIEREYIESDHVAKTRDYVTCFGGSSFFTNKVYEVAATHWDNSISVLDNNKEIHRIDPEYYKTLSQTDIVRIDGVRYELDDRKAEVEEGVIITNARYSYGKYKNGDILSVESVGEKGIENSTVRTAAESANPDGFIYHDEYCVLVPVEESTGYIANTHGDIRRLTDQLKSLSESFSKLRSEVDKLSLREEGNGFAIVDIQQDIGLLKDQIDTNSKDIKTWADDYTQLKGELNTKNEKDKDVEALTKLHGLMEQGWNIHIEGKGKGRVYEMTYEIHGNKPAANANPSNAYSLLDIKNSFATGDTFAEAVDNFLNYISKLN